MLGLNADSVRALLFAGGRGGQGGQGGAPGSGASSQQGGGAQVSPASQAGGRQGRGNLPEVTAQQCAQVTAALAKKPEVQKQLDDLRAKMMSGELDRQAMQAETQKIYAAAGVDAGIARACRQREQGAGAQRASGGNAGGGNAAGGASQNGGVMAGGRGAGGRRGMVFLVENGKYVPKVVRLGVSNFDVSEVVSGLTEGDSVAILNVAAMQARQQEEMDRIRSRGGMPGMQRQQPQQGGAQGGGQGGAQRQGGGNNR
jgi:HlyD family secretion protein